MNIIEKNIIKIKKKIIKYTQKYNRNIQNIKILAVSKNRNIQEIEKAFYLGQTCFGENYIQEAIKKIHNISLNIQWHFIGKIQSNKIHIISKKFSWCHSVTTERHAYLLNKYRSNLEKPLNILIQINMDAEVNKNGILIKNIFNIAHCLTKFKKIKLRGIMVFPYIRNNIKDQIVIYKKINLIFNKLKKNFPSINTLSLGTTQDMEASIASGSTLLRIGKGLFEN
ncbi:YggS family pyridoxal phosphate-dependent enzyme [Buchnera aphidicola (Thelaxes californica)]|uniref:Pyridoxal phosphate homeostasis protein n=1 Tax=Buchnera aphidicola (Thelaxes californica) TaxID=1315998 RepID=A0A4D6YC73_9GAMM|nr:YggS family pyridoxal phosphate-dependent enzyme [Buchnera aphidicola]QCI26949.1 YggS family pyridoxal phosphate-dependent enzyme [Buchnera aphidicola (Thelaxes californica)]